MTGSVKRDSSGTWLYVVDLPRGVDGKRRQRRRRGFPTKKAAEEALRGFMGHLDRGGDPFSDRTTFGEYIEAWLTHHAKLVEPSTLRRYRQLVEIHLMPQLGAMRLNRIRAAHVQAALDSIDRAPRTVAQARAVASKALRQAAAWGLIPASPVQATRAPKAERPDLDVPTADQVQGIMAAAQGTMWEIPVFISAVLGTRRGETLAIRWEDVDLEAARVRIERSVERTTVGFRFKPPKTKRSRREVALPRFAVDRVRSWRSEQLQQRMQVGAAWHDFDLVCERGDGQPIDPDSFSKAFGRFARQVGIQNARLHDLRHAVATTLMERGVHPAVVSRTLGHVNEAFTMSVYGHVRDEMLDAAAKALGEAYG